MGGQILRQIRLFFNRSQGKILEKLVHIVLVNSLAALVILGGIAFFGMTKALQESQEMGISLGETTYRNSSARMVEQRKAELMYIAETNAENINHRMKDTASDVLGIAREAEEIGRFPQRYLPQEVAEVDPENYGNLSFYLQYSPDFPKHDFLHEIGMLANIRDLLTRTIERNKMAESAFVASQHNFVLSVDGERSLSGGQIPDQYYDSLAHDWYQRAAGERKLIISDVREFVFSRQLGLFCAAPYYAADGTVAGVAAMEVSLESLRHVLQEIRLHDGSFCFVTDNRGHVMLSSQDGAYRQDSGMELAINMERDLRQSDNDGLAQTIRFMTEGGKDTRQALIDGRECYIAYAPVDSTGWSFAAVSAAEDVIAPALENRESIKRITHEKTGELKEQLLLLMLSMAVVILFLIALVIYRGKRLATGFAAPIQALEKGVQEIAGGNLSRKVEIHTGDEIEHLAECFNAMTEELARHIKNLTEATAEKERIATELSIAKTIQENMLPRGENPFPAQAGFDLQAEMHAAREVGGDFYDFYLLDENRLVITIADVSGKSVSAALFMVGAKTVLKNFMMTSGGAEDLAAVAYRTNEQLCRGNKANMFVTAFFGMLDLRTGHFVYVNAGHTPPIIYRKATNQWDALPVDCNFVLGGLEEIDYTQQELTLSPGDMLFLCTDGVTEAMNESREMYGDARLLTCLQQAEASRHSCRELLANIRASLEEYVGDAEQSDDITMLAVGYRTRSVGSIALNA